MLQNILAIDKPEVKEISIKKDDKNLDERGKFLELLLKDIESSLDLKDLDSKKDDKLLDKLEKEIENKDDKIEELDINELIKKFDNSLNYDEKFITEVKNIMKSKFKQENILLSKTEIKEFKKIDNLKDLIRFADKKGLNIKKIEVDIAKVIKENPKTKTFFTKLQKIQKNGIENNEKIDIEKFIPTQTKIKLKDKIIKTSNNNDITIHKEKIVIDNKSKTKQENVSENGKKEINLENILFKNTKKEPSEIQVKKVETKENNINHLKNMKKEMPSIEKLLNFENKKVENKVNLSEIKSEVKLENNITPQPTINNELKLKTIQAKETIKHFNQNLDEAIKNYKPPVSKVNIELNPKNLGKVEVSIIQRGNNIQINMNTDQNNVALFQQHQAEFRQALSNIGFSNIDMNFNSQNQDKEKKHNQAKKTYKENEVEEVSDIEIQANYKYA